MNTNVNLLAPIGALALVGTGFLLLVSALILIQSLIAHRKGRARQPDVDVHRLYLWEATWALGQMRDDNGPI